MPQTNCSGLGLIQVTLVLAKFRSDRRKHSGLPSEQMIKTDVWRMSSIIVFCLWLKWQGVD